MVAVVTSSSSSSGEPAAGAHTGAEYRAVVYSSSTVTGIITSCISTNCAPAASSACRIVSGQSILKTGSTVISLSGGAAASVAL